MPRQINEELTRKEMIDPQLEKADWYLRDHSKVKTEIPVDGYDAEPWNGVSDYTLYRDNGEVLAVKYNNKSVFIMTILGHLDFGIQWAIEKFEAT
jgi:type I site-specific restriction endonuclease